MRWLKYFVALAVIVIAIWQVSKKPLIKVDIIYPTLGLVEATVANTRAGTIKACQRAQMSLPIGGQIEHIYVQEGDMVTIGTPLLSLWNKDRKAHIAQVTVDIKVAEQQRNQACIVSDHKQKEATRIAKLHQQKLASIENNEAAISNAASAKATCAAANAHIEAVIARVTTLEAQLEQTYLLAPFDGIVAQVTGEIGEYTTPSPPGVATPPAIDMLTPDCHFIEAPIDEVDAAQIQVGSPVRITLDAFREQAFNGTLKRIFPYVQDYEKQARTVTVEVLFNENDKPQLLAGYSADIEVILERREQVLRLPTDAVVSNNRVYVLNQENIVEKKTVSIGLSNWHFVEVIDGLSTSDRVIDVSSHSKISEGMHVVAHELSEPN